MVVTHAAESDNRHTSCQVPNDTLKESRGASLCATMAEDFRRAFLRHMEQSGATITEIARGTGVSRDVLNKLMARPDSSTSVENGLLVAAFFGKTVNQFVAMQDVGEVDRIAALAELLSQEERRLLEAQMRGIVASGARQSSQRSE